jgi:hypothetical protein
VKICAQFASTTRALWPHKASLVAEHNYGIPVHDEFIRLEKPALQMSLCHSVRNLPAREPECSKERQ